MRKLQSVCAVVFIVILISVLGGLAAYTQAETPTPLSPAYPFEAIPNPGIPTLQTLTTGASTDEEALAMIVTYFQDHEQWLSDTFQETNPTRLRALYAMHIVHISHIYGEALTPPSLLEYIHQRYSHCGVYSVFQAEILAQFGLTWRIFSHVTAEHGWVEVKVDGHWEVFDATTNVWIDQNGFDLVAGVERSYRAFYTPMNDINRPDAREHYWKGPSFNHLVGWYNMPRLRIWMPGLGLYYAPQVNPDQLVIGSSSPGEGGLTSTPWVVST